VQGPPRRLTLQLFASGPGGDSLALAAVGDPRPVRGPVIPVRLWNWPSGVYFARLQAGGEVAYAPFVLRPRTLGTHRIAVVEPTNTWQAYNNFDGQSWYFEGGDTVGLSRPYLDHGVPPHFRGYDLGFLRWLSRTQKQVDFLTDDDLERLDSATRLKSLYDLIVFPGHEEYVTPHVYDLVKRYRDAGGNLMFLSADNFFYRVLRGPDTITRSGRWRDLGRPEAALVGVQYVDWNERAFPNRPYSVVDGSSWVFAGTGLHTGSTFGRYGIEIDSVGAQSPPGTHVLAQITDDFGPGQSAQMTYYELGAAKVFAAGVLNLGGTADWPVVSRIVENVWDRLAAP
jgi:N,N-dimethylformamidase